MKVFISAVAISLLSLSFNSCASHQSCPAYSDSMDKSMKFDNSNQEIIELNTENV
jgi:hypothetical protein